MPYADPARQRQAEREWRDKNRAHVNARALKYTPKRRRVPSTNPKAVARREAYAADPSRDIEYVKKWKAENAIAAKAHQMVRRAIKRGVLVVPATCSVCGGAGDIQAHHEDYSKPLDVKWLCKPHHAEADKSRRDRERAVADAKSAASAVPPQGLNPQSDASTGENATDRPDDSMASAFQNVPICTGQLPKRARDALAASQPERLREGGAV